MCMSLSHKSKLNIAKVMKEMYTIHKRMTKENFFNPSVTADSIIFTIIDDALQVLLIERSNEPFKGARALPGGFIQKGESSFDAVHRILKSKAGVTNVYTEQLYTFDEVKRDPRGQVITIAYFALVQASKIELEKNKFEKPDFFSVKKLPKVAFDHKMIIDYAWKRVQAKLEYTNVAYSLLPQYFTLAQLQHIYEVILDKKIDKRNFIKKFLSLGVIKPTDKKFAPPSRRPATLYTFVSRKPQELKKFF